MAVEQGLFAAIVLAIAVLIVAAGFICYMLRNYCSKASKTSQRNSSNDTSRNQSASVGLAGSSREMRSYKTTTDEEFSQNLPTFDQILRQEEKSSFDFYPLKFPKSPARSSASNHNSLLKSMTTAATVPSRVHEHSQSQSGSTS